MLSPYQITGLLNINIYLKNYWSYKLDFIHAGTSIKAANLWCKSGMPRHAQAEDIKTLRSQKLKEV